MLKSFHTDSNTYYFDSENFTLSTSPKNSVGNSEVKSQIQKDILQKVVINISNNCNDVSFSTFCIVAKTGKDLFILRIYLSSVFIYECICTIIDVFIVPSFI